MHGERCVRRDAGTQLLALLVPKYKHCHNSKGAFYAALQALALLLQQYKYCRSPLVQRGRDRMQGESYTR